MGVDQVEAIRLGGVAFHSFLGDSVLDLLALAVLGQVGEGVLPAISSGSSGSGYHVLAVHQLHGDLGGTDAILVVGVLPALHTIDLDGLGRMGIGDGNAIHLGRVAFHRLFGHGVLNGLASLVDRQILESVQPLAVAISGHGSALHLLAVSQQVHGDARGTLAILVVSVVPELLAGDAGGCGGMAVGNAVTVHLGLVTFNGVLGDAVLDLLTSHMSGQVFEAVLPAIVSSHGGRLSNLTVVDRLHGCHQVHGDAVGTQAILVISVVPNLHAGDAGLARRVAVGDGDEASFLIGLDLGGVFRHLIFGHGVGDQLAASIGIQIGEAELPVAVHVGSHLSLLDLGAVSQQVHGDAGGTLAILVLSVAPDLLAAHRGLDDLVGVGDGEVGDLGGVAFHRSLGDGVGDILTRLLHRQVGEGMLPLAILIDDDRLVHLSAIGQQLHLDVGGALAILVLVVVPGLGYLDLGGGRRMLVDQRHGGSGLVSIPHQFLAGGGVASHSDLFDAISDRLAVLVLVEVGEAPRPAILSGSGGVLEVFAILQQVDGDAVGTQAVLIVGILPFLGAVDSDLLDLVGIGDVVAIRLGGVAFHLILGDGVHDCLAHFARLVHRQVLEAPIPAVVGGHGGRIDFHIISQQTHGDELGTLAVLVVVVLPGLGALRLGGVDVVGVGHGIAGSSVAGHGHGVAGRHGIFFHGILDLFALAELVKVLEGVGPAVSLIQFNRLAGSLVISQQVNGHARGALVVLVVGVFPDLGHLHFGLFDLVGVGDVVAFHLGGVDVLQFLGQIFLNAVGNFLTISMGRQVGEAVLPLGLGVHSLGFLHLTVSQQVHGDGSRPLAVLVVRVVPGLGAGDASHTRIMSVGDGVAASSGAGDLRRLVARHSQLLDGVGDLLAARVLGQLGELIAPAFNRLHVRVGHGLPVGSQLDGDEVRTQAILIVGVLPNLGHADLSLRRGMGVGHGEAGSGVAGDGSLVAVHLILGNGVGNGRAVLVHRQVVEAELPFGGFVHSSHLALNGGAIGQQADGHAFLADAVLVVLVFPHLGAFHLGGGDVVGVGDGVALGRVAGDDRIVIASHLVLGHGVGHDLALFAFLIDRKLFEGSAPVGGSQLGGAILVAVGQQLHGNGSRTQAVAVTVVVPHLGHAHAGLAGRVGVLHVVALHLGGVVAHSALGDGVGDLIAHLAGFVLGQILPLPAPIGASHSLGVDDLAVSQQVDGDVLRTEARHVVEVVPVLLASHGDRLDGVRVGHVVAALGDLGGVASHRFLGDGVDDLLTRRKLGQVLPLPSPAVVSGHLLGFLHGAVSQQVDDDLGGALAIPVALVIPGLGAFHRHHGGSMGVLDVVASHHGSVGLGGILVHVFLHGVDDLRAALVVLNLELGQVGEAVLPLVLGSDSLGFLHLAVSQQLHGDAAGTQAILVVRVVPGLSAFHVDRDRNMAVGDGKAIDDGGVILHLILADGIVDLGTTITIHGQAGEAVLPFAIRISRLSSNGRHLAINRFTVSVQTHGDAVGAQAILVVRVIPGLGAFHVDRGRSMAVGDGKAVDLGGVAFHFDLFDGVHDLRAVRILGQVGEGVRPDAINIRSNGSFLALNRLAVSQQLHGDEVRTQAILVVRVVPGLGHSRRGLLCAAGVGHGHGSNGVLRVPGHGHIGSIVSHRIFGDGVVDQLAVLVLVEVGEADLPLILGSHGHFVDLNASLHQVDGDAAGTLAVLVIRIVPHLGAGDADLLDGMGILDVEVNNLGDVAFHRALFDGVLDQSTLVAILGQAGEAVLPLTLFVGGNVSSASNLVISLQQHDDAVGTLAILVVVVDPGLGARDGSSLGSMGVGHGVASSSAAGDLHTVGIRHIRFFHGVHNRSTLIVLVQISEGGSPLVVSIQHNGLARLLAISQQVDGHAVGTDTVLVAIVLPLLGHGHRGLLGNVSVGHVVAALGDLGGVVRHLFLGDGVDDGRLLAVHILVLGQISPLPSPVVVNGHSLRSDLGTISQQVDDDLLRPHLVAVVVIVPGLAAGNRGGFRRVGVGDGLVIFAVSRLVVFYSIFLHEVSDELTTFILRQVFEAPTGFSRQRHSLARIRRYAVHSLPQVNGNAARTQAITVAIVVPDLVASKIGRVRRVRVGDVHAVVSNGIILNLILGHAIDDFLTAGALINVLKLIAPAIVSRYHSRLAGILTICQQMHGNAGGALAILVVVVLPGLDAAHADLLRRVSVGDVIVVDRSRVAFHRIFSDGVLDLLTRCVLGQILEAVAPVGRSIHGHRILLGTISIQPHGDAIGTDAILVVGIDPGLGAGDVDGLRSMGVLDDEASLRIAGDLGGVVSQRILGHAVDDLHATLKLGLVIPGHLQSIANSNGLVLTRNNHSIVRPNLLGQVKGHIGALAILVVIVIPHLGSGHRGDLGSVAVLNGKVAVLVVGDGGVVASHRSLGHGVGNHLAVFELGQIIPGHFQSIAGCIRSDVLVLILDNHSSGLAHLLVQVQGHILAQAILVVVVVPNLGGSHRNNFRGMRVGDCQGILIQTLAVSSNVSFVHRVFNLHFVRIHRNVLESVSEAISFSHINHSFRNNGIAVLQEQSNLFRTHAITVAVVIPNLGHSHVLDFGRVVVGNGIGNSLAVFACYSIRGVRAITLRQFGSFQHRIGNSFAIGLLVQVRPGVFPAIGSVQRHRIAAVVAIGLQLHSNAGRTLAILVVGIIPPLLHTDVDLLNLVRIGQGGGVAVFAGGLAQRIVVHRLFRPGILNQLVVHILGLIFNGSSPVGGSQRNDRISCLVILHQGDLQARGTLAVLVTLVFPHLLHGHINKDGIQRVGDGEAGGGIATVSSGVACNCRDFGNRIHDLRAIRLLGFHIRPSIFPKILCIQHNRLAIVHTIGTELHLNRRGTILRVIAVIPNLFYLNINLIRRNLSELGNEGGLFIPLLGLVVIQIVLGSLLVQSSIFGYQFIALVPANKLIVSFGRGSRAKQRFARLAVDCIKVMIDATAFFCNVIYVDGGVGVELHVTIDHLKIVVRSAGNITIIEHPGRIRMVQISMLIIQVHFPYRVIRLRRNFLSCDNIALTILFIIRSIRVSGIGLVCNLLTIQIIAHIKFNRL